MSETIVELTAYTILMFVTIQLLKPVIGWTNLYWFPIVYGALTLWGYCNGF